MEAARIARISGLLAVGALVLGLSACAEEPSSTGPTEVVAEVNGQMITTDEIAFRMRMLAPEVDNATADDGLDAEAREAALRDEALERALADAQLFSLAREEGLIGYRDFDGFLGELDRENRERARAVAAGEIVYGLTEFTPEQYYTRTVTQLRQQLVRDLSDDAGGPLAVGEDEVRAHFDQNSRRWEAAAATYRVRLFDLPSTLANQPTCGGSLLVAAEGGPVAAIRRDCPGVRVTQRVLRGTSRPETASPEGQALSSIELLGPGEATGPLPDGARVTVYQLLDKDVDTEAAYDVYRERVRQSLLTERLDQLLADRREAADPDIDQSALDTITTEEA